MEIRSTAIGLLGAVLIVAVPACSISSQATGDGKSSTPITTSAPSPLDALAEAAAKRLQTADPVAAVKWITHGHVEDPARVSQVLDAAAAAAAGHNIDPEYVRRVFGDQVAATEAIEYEHFAEWKFDPSSAPSTAPDLASSRNAIDALNAQMVDQIAAQWQVLHSSNCRSAVQTSTTNAGDAVKLDDLHRKALAAATRSYCA